MSQFDAVLQQRDPADRADRANPAHATDADQAAHADHADHAAQADHAAHAEALATLRTAIESIVDPEMNGVTIGQLGMVLDVRMGSAGDVEVDFSPTFLGCVAVGLIALDIENTVLRGVAANESRPAPLISECRVKVVHNIWNPDRISKSGVEQLRTLGIVVVRSDQRLEKVGCPVCAGPGLERRGGSGPTRCRTVAWCTGCRNVVEVMESPPSDRATSGTYAHI